VSEKKYRLTIVFGDVIIRPYHDEACRRNTVIQHANGLTEEIPDGSTSDVLKWVDAAIERQKTLTTALEKGE